jgi:hypothetical protein
LRVALLLAEASWCGSGLVDAEAFAHEALEAGAPDEVVGEVFAGEHGEGGGAGVGDHLGGVVDGEGAVLGDGLLDEVHHHLEAAEEAGFLGGLIGGGDGGVGGGVCGGGWLGWGWFVQSRLLGGLGAMWWRVGGGRAGNGRGRSRSPSRMTSKKSKCNCKCKCNCKGNG